MSDITLGDFWGISNFAPDYDDDKGTSLLLIRSVKGEEALKSVELTSVEVKYEDALQGNICIECDAVQSPLSERFWQEYPLSGIKCLEKIVDELRPSLVCLIYTKARNRIVRFAKKIVTKP